MHRDRERLGRRQSGPEPAVHQQRPHVAEGDLADQVFDVDAPVAQRPAVLVRLGDLSAEGDVALESKRETRRRGATSGLAAAVVSALDTKPPCEGPNNGVG